MNQFDGHFDFLRRKVSSYFYQPANSFKILALYFLAIPNPVQPFSAIRAAICGSRPGNGQAVEKIFGIDPQGAAPITTFLDDQDGKSQLSDHTAIAFKISCSQGPGAGGISFGGVQAQCQNQKIGFKSVDALQGPGQRRAVFFPIHQLGQRQIQVETLAFTFAHIFREAGKIRVSETRMAVDGHRQHV